MSEETVHNPHDQLFKEAFSRHEIKAFLLHHRNWRDPLRHVGATASCTSLYNLTDAVIAIVEGD